MKLFVLLLYQVLAQRNFKQNLGDGFETFASEF
jgi:hypothetical protein